MAATRKARKTAKRVMREYKRGTLKSGGRRTVKSRKQAIAIAMSESGQSRNRPRRKAGAKRKTAAKRGAARKKGRS